MTATSRDRLLEATAALLASRGLGATSVRDVAQESGVSQGSLYHFFPDGKEALVEETVARVSDQFNEVLRVEGGSTSALQRFDAFIAAWRQALRATDFRASCPVLAVATADVRDDDTVVASAASAALREWHATLRISLHAGGASRTEARDLAWALIAGVEGAVALSRSQRDLKPLDATAKVLRTAIRTAVGDGS